MGLILLDKDTLEEKKSFSTYIYADLKGRTSSISGITQEMLDSAPSQAEVGKMIFEKFGNDFLIASWVSNMDINHLRKIMNAAEIDWEQFDYHIFDIWPAAYIHLLKQGYNGGIRSEDIFQAFGAKPRGLHDALEDCRITADIIRKLVLV